VASAAVGTAFEAIENAVWDEAAAHRQNMTIAMPMLMSAEEAQWLHQVQMLPRARHGHVEETAFFLDLLVIPESHVRGDAAIGELSTNTASHSWPFAEWIVDSTR